MGCQLCDAEQITPWFDFNDVCWVAICAQCDVPMVVLWRHTASPTRQELEVMRMSLEEAAIDFYGTHPWYIEAAMRSIPDHAHMHARPR
jgi:hypothetical protein